MVYHLDYTRRCKKLMMGVFMRIIGQRNIDVLASSDLRNEIIALDNSEDDDQNIILIARDKLSFVNEFLKYFNQGCLRNVTTNLRDVAGYLNTYDWSLDVFNEPAGSSTNNAYIKVCFVANQLLWVYLDMSLYNNVSNFCSIEKVIQKQVILDGQVISSNQLVRYIRWNPAIQVKHIERILDLSDNHPSSMTVFSIQDKDQQVLARNMFLSQTALLESNICARILLSLQKFRSV